MMRKTLHVAVAALAGVALAAAPAAAQICSGYPTLPGQTSLGLRASFPTGGTSLGVEASRNWNNPMGAFASLTLMMPEADDADNRPVFGAGLAYEVTEFLPVVPTWLSVCPVAAVSFGSSGGTTELSIPLGVGFGMSIGTTEAFTIHPWVRPQFVLTRISVDGIDDPTDNNNFGFGAGAYAKFGGVYAGVTLGRLFIDNASTDITFQGGITVPARLP